MIRRKGMARGYGVSISQWAYTTQRILDRVTVERALAEAAKAERIADHAEIDKRVWVFADRKVSIDNVGMVELTENLPIELVDPLLVIISEYLRTFLKHKEDEGTPYIPKVAPV